MEDNSSNRKQRKNGQIEGAHHESRRPSIGNIGQPGPSTRPPLPHPLPHEQNGQRKRPHPGRNTRAPCKETDAVDRIWHDIDVEQREKMARRKEEAKRREKPAPSPRDYLPLTSNNLKNFKNEDSAITDFINRAGMVDKLLGYKMLLGRMENCGTLGYEKMSDEEIHGLSNEWRKLHPQEDEAENKHQAVGPHTPPSPMKDHEKELENSSPDRPRVGPKTPPGSPSHTNPADQTAVNRRELIEQLAKNFGISAGKVEETLGDGLDKALEDCSKKIKNQLMETFKEQLQSQIEKKPIKSDLSDQMELVSEDSLSIDMKIPKKEEPETTMYHMVIPPPPIPPSIQPPPYQFYHQNAPPAFPYAPPPPPPPPQPPYQQNMCYPPPPQPLVPNAPPPPIHYQVQNSQQYQQPAPSSSTIVLPPVNVPPPPIGVRIDTPMPQSIPSVVQTLPPTGMPPPPIQTKVPPPPLPPQIQAAPPPMPSTSFSGDCWRSGPPIAHPPNNPSEAWQQQPPPHPVAPPAVTVPVSSSQTVVNVQSTLFSALGLHKFPPPPPPPPGSGNSHPPIPFSSLSTLPPPPPPPVAGPSPPCGSLTFIPPPPPIHQNNIGPSGQSGYRHHGHNNNRKSHYQNSFSKKY